MFFFLTKNLNLCFVHLGGKLMESTVIAKNTL